MKTILGMANVLSPYENTSIETIIDYAERKKSAISFNDLSEKSFGGIPIGSYRDKDNRLQTVFVPETHSLIIGSTRSGKTTGFVIPLIMLKSMQKVQDSLLITDPKGELYTICSERLRKLGYKVILLNFRDYAHSETWNPLTPIFRKYQKAFSLHKEVKAKEAGGKYYSEYRGKTYRSVNELSKVIERDKQIILHDVENDINTLALSLITTEHADDPYWEDSARQLLTAFIYALLEDSIPETAGDRMLITEETFSLRTILQIYSTFHYGSDSISGSEGDNGFFCKRSENSKARAYAMSSIIANAGNTRLCVLSSFNAKMAPYKEIYTNLITSSCSFELDDLVDDSQPVAVFVVYRDEVRTSYYAIKSFITSVYKRLIEIANAQPDLRLARPFVFMLDEFGNFPAISDFDTTISACGGRNIWFQIVLQSYAQLENNYGKETAEIIKENLNMHMFFGTNNAETKRQFSEECGKKTIISPRGVFAGQQETVGDVGLEEVSAVPVSKLNCLATGDCYITMSNAESVLHSHMERSYLCPEYVCPKSSLYEYDAGVDVLDNKYTYTSAKKETNPGSRRKSNWSDFF